MLKKLFLIRDKIEIPPDHVNYFILEVINMFNPFS